MRGRCRVGAVLVAAVTLATAASVVPGADAGPYAPSASAIVSRPDGAGQATQASGLGERIEVADNSNDIVFVTNDATLAPGDTNARRDVYVKSFSTSDVTRASLGVGGVEPNQHSGQPAMSGDGGVVAFVTTASNLGISDVNGLADVYVRDLDTEVTTLGSTGHSPGNGGAEPSLSQDGRYLAFSRSGKVYRRDRVAETTEEVSVNSNEVTANGSCGAPSISDDGNRVVFTCASSTTNLAISDTNGSPDVFVRDVTTGTTLRASLSNAGQQLPAGGSGGRISGDGMTVGFISSSPAIAGGVALGTEVYLRQLGFGATILGSRANGTTTTGGAPGVVQAFDLTDDGTGVIFQATPGTWQPFPVSAASDIYSHNRTTSCTWLSSTAGLQGGNGTSRSPAVSGTTLGYAAWSSTGTNLSNPDLNGVLEDIFFVQQYCPPAQRFSDVGYAHPFFTEINWMVSLALTSGWDDGTFRPTNAVSRQAMASFLWKLEASPPPVGPAPTFSDVPADHPFRSAIWWMVGEGLTGGYVDNTFRPTNPVSRQALAAFLYELAGSPAFSPPAVPFTDVPVDHPFYDAISWMDDKGIADGYPDGSFKPTAPVSRQAAAAFLQRYKSSVGPK